MAACRQGAAVLSRDATAASYDKKTSAVKCVCDEEQLQVNSNPLLLTVIGGICCCWRCIQSMVAGVLAVMECLLAALLLAVRAFVSVSRAAAVATISTAHSSGISTCRCVAVTMLSRCSCRVEQSYAQQAALICLSYC
jgi:hypothetical protein